MWVTRGYESLPWVGFAARVLTCLSSEPTGVLTPLTPRRFLLCFFENLFLSFKSKLNYACRYTPFILEAKTRFLPLVHTFVHEAYRDPWKWYLKKKTQAASYITGTGHDTVWKQKPSHALSAVPPAIATTSTFGEIFLRESVLSWALCCMLLSLDPQSRPLNSFKDSLVGKLCPCLSGHNHSFSPVCIQSDAAQFSAQEYWSTTSPMLISSPVDPKVT